MDKLTHSTDWSDIDLNSSYEKDLNIVDPYSFNTLLLEISCNLKDINKETVKKLYSDALWAKIDTANEVFEANLDNIVKQAKKERKE